MAQANAKREFNYLNETTHYISDSEVAAYVQWINKVLASDEDLQSVLPLQSNSLFDACRDGLLLCKLINNSVPGTIQEKGLHRKAKSTIHMSENVTKALAGAVRIGCRVTNLGPEDIKNATPHLCLGLIWQIIKVGLLRSLIIDQNGQSNLGASSENLASRSDSQQSSSASEKTLLAWLNNVLENTNCPKRVNNFGSDLADSVCLAYLVQQVGGQHSNLNIQELLNEQNLQRRADLVLNAAEQINCRQFASADDIVAGNKNLNLAFVAVLHNALVAKQRSEKIEGVRADAAADLRRINVDNETKIQQLKEELARSQEDLRNLRERLDNEIQQRQVQSQQQQQQQHQAQQAFQQLEQQSQNLAAQLQERERFAQHQQQQAQQNQQALQQLEQQSQNVLAQLKEKENFSQQQARQAEEAQKAYNKLQAQLREQQEQLARLQQSYDQEQAQNQQNQNNLQRSQQQLEDSLRLADQLRSQLKDNESQFQRAQSEGRDTQNRLQDSLQQQIQKLLEQNQNLQQQLLSSQSSLRDAEQQLRNAQDQNQGLQSELNSSKQLARSFEQTNASFRDQVKSLDDKLDNSERRGRDLEQRLRLAEERQQKSEQERNAATDAARAAEVAQSSLRQQLNEAQQQLEGLYKRNETQDSDASRQLRELRQELARVRTAKDSEIAELSTKLITKESELVRALNDVTDAKESLRAQKLRSENLENARDAAQNALQESRLESDRRLEELRAELRNFENERAELQRRNQSRDADKQTLAQQLQNAQDELDNLRIGFDAEAAALNTRIAALDAELRLAREDSQRARDSIREQAERFESVEALKDSTIQNLREQLAERERTAVANAAASTAAYATLNREAQGLRTRLEEVDKETQNLRQRLQDGRKAAADYDNLRNELQEAQRFRAEAEVVSRQFNEKIQALERRAASSRAEADALRAENESLKNGTFAAQSNSEGLSLELSIARSVAESAEKENLQLQSKALRQEETIKRLQENASNLEARVQALTQNSNQENALREQLQQAQRRLAQLEDSNDGLEQQLQDAQRSAASANAASESLRQQNATLRENNQKTAQSIQTLRESLQSAERELSMYRSARGNNQQDELQQRLQNVESRINSAANQLQNSNANLSQVGNEAYLQERLALLENRLQETTRNLQVTKEAYENEANNLKAQLRILKDQRQQNNNNDQQAAGVPSEALLQLMDTIRNVTEACNKRRDAILSSIDTLHEESSSSNGSQKRLNVLDGEDSFQRQIGDLQRITVNLLDRQYIPAQQNGVIEVENLINSLSRHRQDFLEASNLKGQTAKSGAELVNALDNYFRHLDNKAQKSERRAAELSRSVDNLNDELRRARQSAQSLSELNQASDRQGSIEASSSAMNLELNTELNSLRNRSQGNNNDVFLARSRQTIEKAMKAIDALRKENKVLKSKLSLVDRDHAQIQNQISNVDPNSASSEEVALIANLQNENNQLREKLENIEQIGTSLKEQSEQLCEDSSKARSPEEKTIRELNKKIDALLDENSRIKQQLEISQSYEQSQKEKLRDASSAVNIATEATSTTLNLISSLRKDNLRLRQRIRLGAQAELKLIDRLKEVAYSRGGRSVEELEEEKQRLEEQLAEAERASTALLAQRSLLINEREYIISNSLGSLNDRANSRYASIENFRQQQQNGNASGSVQNLSNNNADRSNNQNGNRASNQNLSERQQEARNAKKSSNEINQNNNRASNQYLSRDNALSQ
ncbi:hypothetical protein HDV05_003718 [Chytridiales sp. JEL 0842]|nr:hypothetical protein HDV05_003718 [Chytridiales sp. JEL 0842]